MNANLQIVIAWTEEDQVLIKAGRADIGESHKFRTIQSPRACMWLNKGKYGDVEKAKAYAAKEGRRVFVYQSESDPLSRAKREVLK